MTLQVVTALYDLGRASSDGRTIDWYLDRLAETLRRFPSAMVFHDGCVTASVAQSDNRIVRVDRSELPPFALLDRVRAVREEWTPAAPEDVTHKLPEYALIQYSKFWLMERAAVETNAEWILWVDAAVSRFVPFDEPAQIDSIEVDLASRTGSGDGLFEVDLHRNITPGLKMRRPAVGSCRRVMSGTSFAIRRESVRNYADVTLELASNWLRNGMWDNEQIALTHLLLDHRIRPTLLRSSSRTPGAVARTTQSTEHLQAITPASWAYRMFTRTSEAKR